MLDYSDDRNELILKIKRKLVINPVKIFIQEWLESLIMEPYDPEKLQKSLYKKLRKKFDFKITTGQLLEDEFRSGVYKMDIVIELKNHYECIVISVEINYN